MPSLDSYGQLVVVGLPQLSCRGYLEEDRSEPTVHRREGWMTGILLTVRCVEALNDLVKG